jgi:hypothetical protein
MGLPRSEDGDPEWTAGWVEAPLERHAAQFALQQLNPEQNESTK